jgi:hypothetical protein
MVNKVNGSTFPGIKLKSPQHHNTTQCNMYENNIQCSKGVDALTILKALVALPTEAATILVSKLKI